MYKFQISKLKITFTPYFKIDKFDIIFYGIRFNLQKNIDMDVFYRICGEAPIYMNTDIAEVLKVNPALLIGVVLLLAGWLASRIVLEVC